MKKRVLLISPVPTHPASSGNRVRVKTLLSNLGKTGYEAHFAHIQRESGDNELMESCWGDYYHPIGYNRREPALATRVSRKLATLLDPANAHVKTIDEWYDAGVDEALVRLNKKFRFNVVIVEYVFFSKALECFDRKVTKIIDAHDVFSDRHKLYLENGQSPSWFSTSRRQERKGFNRADIVIAIQDNERERIAQLCRRPVITIGHSVKLVEPVFEKTACTLLYIGSNNSINVQSLTYFIEEIMPLVKEHFPRVRLNIAGTVCDDIHVSESFITKLGRVSDLDEIYASADVVVNPMRYGTGLKIKNIEALGYSKPLVTTSSGAEGLNPGAGKAFLVANNPNEWCSMVVKLLKDSDYRFSVQRKATEFARRWNKEIEDSLSRAIEGRL